MNNMKQGAVAETPLSIVPKAWDGGADIASAKSAPIGDHDILHLAELVPILRQRLEIDAALSDDAILASLKVIAACSLPRDRWRAAFGSNLGHWLALQGRDLNTALNTVVALLPRPRL